MASQDKRLTKIRPNGMEDIPEYRVDIDWEKAGALGVNIKLDSLCNFDRVRQRIYQ